MPIPYKVVGRKNPRQPDEPVKYYPQLVTMGNTRKIGELIYEIKENSSLSEGDIRSVLSNFVSVMRRSLYSGISVNVDGFGVFSLSARSEGSDDKKTVNAENIRSVKINFRASSAVRPSLTAKNPGDRLVFYNPETSLAPDVPDSGSGGEDSEL